MHLMVYGELVQKPQNQCAEALLSTLPESLDNIYFLNSGSEAIEAALKLAKRATGRPKIACFGKGLPWLFRWGPLFDWGRVVSPKLYPPPTGYCQVGIQQPRLP